MECFEVGECLDFRKTKVQFHKRSLRKRAGGRYGVLNPSGIALNRAFLFIKRHPYRGEKEYRILWEGRTGSKRIAFPIDLKSINGVLLIRHRI